MYVKIILFLSAMLISGIFVMSTVYGDAIPPVRQINAGIIISEVVCNDDLVRVIDAAKSRAICVKDSTAQIFSERGWEVSPGRAVQIVQVENTLNPVSTTNIDTGSGRSSAVPFNHVFEVCAGHVTYVAPKVIIRSDIETKSVTVSVDVPANSCLLSAATIFAINPDSIRSELTSQDSIVLKISDVRSEINRLTQQLEDERVKFAAVLLEPDSDEKRQKVDESIGKIAQLRQSLANIKDDLNRYYFVLYGGAGSKSAQIPSTTFAGQEIAGNSVSILSITPARVQGNFDAVIELCAGSSSMANPMVTLSSDSHERTVKLNRINADSCYKTGAKIQATSADSVVVRFTEGTTTHSVLENTVRDLEAQISQKRAELASLTQGTTNSDPIEINRLTGEMTSLRDEILTAKSLLHQSLYKAYKSE